MLHNKSFGNVTSLLFGEVMSLLFVFGLYRLALEFALEVVLRFIRLHNASAYITHLPT
jgi:hypothetical protein